ncbi:hypothetical protein [Solimonas marina]|uniref:Uncharacterized protein n=1 Tax=Solimonas marina TaxID=2714601 RepID=A0A970B9T1_9GAMM|nr:hypothetical protein [Solimonas marina]NKF22671.1 hypothetical protein [Solimonas marina]
MALSKYTTTTTAYITNAILRPSLICYIAIASGHWGMAALITALSFFAIIRLQLFSNLPRWPLAAKLQLLFIALSYGVAAFVDFGYVNRYILWGPVIVLGISGIVSYAALKAAEDRNQI